MLEKIKKALRINHKRLDDDIIFNIDACSLDMKRAGIKKYDEDDALIYKATELYCKWQYNYDGEAERYERSYIKLRDALSLCGDYIAE